MRVQQLRYQRGNQKPEIEGRTIQLPNQKEQTMIYKSYTEN